MPTLPTPGADYDSWGTELNEFLSVAHEADGRLKNVYNVRDFGAAADGFTDDGPAILAAVQAAWDEPTPATVTPAPTVFVPAGTYYIVTPIDFTTLNLTYTPVGWSFYCEPGAVFMDGTSAGPVIDVTHPDSSEQFYGCYLRIGRIQGYNLASNDGVRLLGWNNSFIDIGAIVSMAGTGLVIGESSTVGTFNNLIRIGYITNCDGPGMAVEGNATLYGFQANLVQAGLIKDNGTGIIIDSTTGLNSRSNYFELGCVETNGVGVLDNNGRNQWIFANTNNNPIAFETPLAADGIPVIRGYIEDGFDGSGIDGNLSVLDCINYYTLPGNRTAPSVPVSTDPIANPYDRPLIIYVNGGTVSVIKIGGVATGATSGVFRLLTGQTIEITYSVVPTWTWFLE